MQPLTPGDPLGTSLVINEFMAHPAASATHAEGEWIELYNPSSQWLNLSGWKIRNLLGQQMTLCSFLVPPAGYAVVGASSDAGRNGGYEPDLVYTDFTMEDTGTLILIAPGGAEVDRIDYGFAWPIESGRSCEKINPGWASNLASSWAASNAVFGNGDKGTPGEENSVFQNSFAQNTWAFIKAFVE